MRALLVAALVLATCLVSLTALAGDGTARFAVVIGNNRPEAGPLANLRYADDDAVLVHRLLEEAGVESALLVTLDTDSRALHASASASGRPTLRDLSRAVDAWSARLRTAAASGMRTELFVYYSGHGDVDRGEGYVVLEDGRLTRSRLYELLARTGANQNHVFVDACKSYFLAFEKGPGGRRTPYAGAFIGGNVPAALDNTGFVLSTSSDRESHEWERFQAGILSHELRSALRGAADANLDGRVTYAELAAFLTIANRAIPNARFRPDFLVRPPRRSFEGVVLGWSGASAAVRLEPGALGHVYLETAQGIRLADVPASRGQPIVLHAPAERPLFLRRNDETAEFVVNGRALADVNDLDFGPSQIASRGALHLAFERLFAVPFGPSDVREFERARATPLPSALTTPSVRDAGTTPRSFIGTASGITALGALAGGLTLTTLSAIDYFGSEGGSQVELERSNRRVRTLNLASLACYGLAAAAGATWALTELSRGPSVSVAVGGGAPSGEINVGGRF